GCGTWAFPVEGWWGPRQEARCRWRLADPGRGPGFQGARAAVRRQWKPCPGRGVLRCDTRDIGPGAARCGRSADQVVVVREGDRRGAAVQSELAVQAREVV